MYHLQYSGASPLKRILCAAVYQYCCAGVNLSIPLHGSIPPTPTVPLAKKETKSSWGGAAEKIKSASQERRGCSHFTVTLLFSVPRCCSLCFSAPDMIRPPILFVFLCSFLLICFGTSARGDWSFPLWPRPCLVLSNFQFWHYAKKRFPVISNLWYMHEVLNVDEIKN